LKPVKCVVKSPKFKGGGNTYCQIVSLEITRISFVEKKILIMFKK